MGKVKLIDDFKAFALKGNVVDMAVGVIIGGAFGKIVTSLVNDVIMPPIGVLLDEVDFKELSWVMVEAVGDKPAVSINYGNFIQVVIDFLIIAWVVFLAIRAMMKMKRKQAEAPAPAPAPPAPSKEEVLLTEIRDLLKK